MEKKKYIEPCVNFQQLALSQIIALSTDEDDFEGSGGWDAKGRDKEEPKGSWNHLW